VTEPLADVVRASLFERRVVLVHGDLDASASDAAAALMTLDALGDDHVELRLQGCDGTLEAGFVLIDAIEVLGVPVHASALGLVSGGAVGVLAVCTRRVLAPHARLQLREPDVAVAGRSGEFERAAAEAARRRTQFRRHLAHATGRTLDQIDEDWEGGRFIDAETAVAWGYADAVEISGRP